MMPTLVGYQPKEAEGQEINKEFYCKTRKEKKAHFSHIAVLRIPLLYYIIWETAFKARNITLTHFHKHVSLTVPEFRILALIGLAR